MKFSVLLLLLLILGACQKEPEVNVNKVIKCFSSKAVNKTELCDQLNDAEKAALACITAKGKSASECKDFSMTDMTLFMDREREPAKRRGTQFKIPLSSNNSGQNNKE